MAHTRRKLSASLGDFQAEINRLLRFDSDNQRRFSLSAGSRPRNGLTKRQLHFLTESVFLTAYREFEGFIQDIFLLYTLEKTPKTGSTVRSFLKPRDFAHAGELIKSSMPFLEWTNPDSVIERAELYLLDGFPIKLPYTTSKETLSDLKTIRNHIAHNSNESTAKYTRVLRKHYGTIPLKVPSPGEFLLVNDKKDPSKYKLVVYLEFLKQLSTDLT